jgi:hypothetical protein
MRPVGDSLCLRTWAHAALESRWNTGLPHGVQLCRGGGGCGILAERGGTGAGGCPSSCMRGAGGSTHEAAGAE